MRTDRISGKRTRRRALPSLGVRAALACSWFFATGAQTPVQNAERVETTRTTLEEYVETRRLISKERRDWALKQEVLADRIELVQREIESLRARIAEARESIADADEKRAELIDENERLKQAASSLETIVVRLEGQTRRLVGALPDPIKERVKPLSQGLPEASAETKQSLSERYQNIAGILDQTNKFNREITVTSEVRTLADGTTAEVAALYVGIGQGYYVDATGTAAGTGSASPAGWSWTPADHAAARIAQAIAILKEGEQASFVHLPIRIGPQGR